MTLYNTLIVPIFNYTDIIWGGCNKTQGKRLQITQNFAARSILGKSKYDSGKLALKELNLLNLKNAGWFTSLFSPIKVSLKNYQKISKVDIIYTCQNFQLEVGKIVNSTYHNIISQNLKNPLFIDQCKPRTNYQKIFLLEI